MTLYYGGGEETRLRAAEASERAVEIASGLPEARAARGLALSLGGDYQAAETEFDAALKLHPRHFEALYLSGRVLFSQRKYEAALDRFEGAAKVRPEEFQNLTLAAKALRFLGRQEEALAVHERALAVADHRLELQPEDARALSNRACALVELGRVEAGLAAADLARTIQPEEAMLYYPACAYARAGETGRALDCLEEAIGGGWSHWDWLEADRDLDSLRGNERFQALALR